MNLLHVKYAVAVAETGSINKAAEKLLVGQPNLSRAIKELESSLDLRIFERSAKGMTLTPEGEAFIESARTILRNVDEVEETFRKGVRVRKRFSVSAARAAYMAAAFARFTCLLDHEADVEVFYQETDAHNTIASVQQEECRLGILRYDAEYDRYFKAVLEEKGLAHEMIIEFRPVLLMRADSPLAGKERLSTGDLAACIEIAGVDRQLPAEVRKPETNDAQRRILVSGRGGQLALLRDNPTTFLRTSPLPEAELEQLGLVQRRQTGVGKVRDVLIRRKEYALSKLDNAFIVELCKAKREFFGQKDA